MSTLPGSAERPRSGVEEPPTKLWWASFGLAAVGLIDSIYLTWIKWAGAYSSCVGAGDCELVNQSRYAELWGQPIALLGALGYLTILVLLAAERTGPKASEYGPLLIFGLTLAGTLYSAYLTYVEVAVLQAICPYCVLSAVAMTGLWILSIPRLQQGYLGEA